MRKRNLLCVIVAVVMLFGGVFTGCTVNGGDKKPGTGDNSGGNYTVTEEAALKYEQNLTWGEENHLYIHYLRGAHSEKEHGKTNSAAAPDYSAPISSDVYGDWGLWVWAGRFIR